MERVGVAHVRCVDGEDHVRLQLQLKGERKTFYRPTGEKLEKIRHRLQLLAAGGVGSGVGKANGPKKKKKKHKKSGEQQNQQEDLVSEGNAAESKSLNSFVARFWDAEGREIDGKQLVGDAMLRTARISVGDEMFQVLYNQPVVVSVNVVEPLLVGIPVLPMAHTDFCGDDDCSWQWFRLRDGEDDISGGELWCSSRRYKPSNADVGCRFRIECRAPTKFDAAVEASKASLLTMPTHHGPDRDGITFQKRRELGSQPCDDGNGSFRVMTYNVLFDGYTTSIRAKRNLFPYVDPAVIKETYRAQLIFQDIEESNSDIVCLQEVGEDLYNSFYEPMLRTLGFDGFYSGKSGSTREGCATFIRLSKFRACQQHTLSISVAATESGADPAVDALLAEFPEIAAGVRRVPSIAQIMVLAMTSDESKRVLVSNTHLFYREDSHMIRLVQCATLVRTLYSYRSELQQESNDSVVPAVVMCGDYNATPGTITTDYVLNGVVHSSHRHWAAAPSFRWERSSGGDPSPGCLVNNVMESSSSFAHPLRLVSGCGIPAFTNYARSFIGALDYIFVDRDRLQVHSAFPLFSEEEVTEEVAMPSSKFPSDHISLVCDLKWCQ